MKRIRLLLAAISILMLVAGYATSQYAYFNGTAPDYAAAVDRPPVVVVALLIFVAAVVLGFLPDREDRQA